MQAQTPARRKRITVAEKLEIIETTRTWSVKRAAAEYGVSRASITAWRANEATLRQQSAASGQACSSGDGAQQDTAVPPHVVRRDDLGAHASGGHLPAGRCAASASPRNQRARASSVDAPVLPASTATSSSAAPSRPERSAPPARDAAPPDHPALSSSSPLAPSASVSLVGYAGLSGTVADVAVQDFFPLLQVGVAARAGSLFETVGYPHAIDAMDAVVRREVDYCVVPTNWLLSISASFALAEFMSRPLRVVAEILSKPRLCLSAMPGTALSDCRCVLSDSALLQAHEALILDLEAERGERIVRQAAWDSAGACVSVREQGSRGVAVLATKETARAAGLSVLVDGIHDADADVHARFLVLGRPGCAHISPRSSAARPVRSVQKTTLLASVFNQPAWLANIIRVFADASVPVLGVQTRLLAPWSASPMHAHQLLVSFLTTEQATHCALSSELLERLGEVTVSLHVVGTYFSMSAVPPPGAGEGAQNP